MSKHKIEVTPEQLRLIRIAVLGFAQQRRVAVDVAKQYGAKSYMKMYEEEAKECDAIYNYLAGIA